MRDEKKALKVTLRKFEFEDIPNKVRWINDPLVNKYLHYDLPMRVDKTEKWFLANKNRDDRYDAVILVDGQPVGLIGLLSINYDTREAEYYISIGETEWFGKGIATKAVAELLDYAFYDLALNRINISIESENISSIRLNLKYGFVRDDSLSDGSPNKIFYKLDRVDYQKKFVTPVTPVDSDGDNDIYIKRDDLLPFSFGGNKARKAEYFFDEIDRGDCTCVVTYGSSSSNHCRVVSNMAAKRGLKCMIISPSESSFPTNNSKFMKLFGADIITTPVSEVHDTIESTLDKLTKSGEKPYFIPGGGHGVLGTSAYVDCYWEIKKYEKENRVFFDYIFFASGTGTTHSGLVCGLLLSGDKRNIVGISIARKNPRGRQVVIDSIREYLTEKRIPFSDDEVESLTVFNDEYTGDGYAKTSESITSTIDEMLVKNGIPFDCTYTGKAYTGMLDYLKKNEIKNKNILFIHTGGTPLFFDYFAEK